MKMETVMMFGDGHSVNYSIEMPPGVVAYVLLNGCSLMMDLNYTISYPEGIDTVTLTFKKPLFKTDRLAVTFHVYEHYFSWCPSCFKKHRSLDSYTTVCVSCNTETIPLDIDDTIYSRLPEFCSKGDIVEASLGIAV